MLDPRHLTPDEFTQILDKVPWLARLGCPESADDGVLPIGGWEEWPGPEDPRMELLSSRLQNWKGQLMAFWACSQLVPPHCR